MEADAKGYLASPSAHPSTKHPLALPLTTAALPPPASRPPSSLSRTSQLLSLFAIGPFVDLPHDVYIPWCTSARSKLAQRNERILLHSSRRVLFQFTPPLVNELEWCENKLVV